MFKTCLKFLKAEHLLASGDTGYTAADYFQNARRANGLNKAVQLFAVTCQLDRVDRAGHIHNLATENVYRAFDLGTLGTSGLQFDQHQLTLDVGTFGQIHQLDDFDQLVQLLGDLFDHLVRTRRGHGKTGQSLVFGWRHGERFDVVVALGKQTNNP